MGRALAGRRQRFPLGAEVSLDVLDVDPYPVFDLLREREPVSWVDEVEMWFVTRRQDCVRVLSDPQTFGVGGPRSLLGDTFGPTMLSTDGDEQYRLRHTAAFAFAARALRERVAPAIERIVHDLIDGIEDAGEADLVASFANPLALRAVTEVLGIEDADIATFRDWYDAFAAALANFRGDAQVRGRGRSARRAFEELVGPALHGSCPHGSALAAMVDGGGMSDDEVLSGAMLILFGGLETTQAMLANTVWALLGHSEQLEAVRADPSLVRPALEESLRWESPVQSCTRRAMRPVDLGGVEVAEGEVVQCMLGAANRDPQHYADPARFDIGRTNAADHLSFAVGKHFCIGATLARLEGWIGLPVVLERLWGLSADASRSAAPRGYEFRSPPTLHVRWHPA